jgi:flagellar basal-body rod modification protein FlgD
METPTVDANPVVTTKQPTSRGFDQLGSEEFFALLIAELQSQDPLSPMDNQQFLNQMASIRQMEQSSLLNDTLEALASEQRFGATAGLIGHYVSGTLTNDAGQSFEMQGLVIGVRFEPGGRAILELHDGSAIPADAVDQVTIVDNLPANILEQLQEELNPTGNENEEEAGEEGSEAGAAARPLKRDLAPARTVTGDLVRQFGRQVDTTAGLLDALLAPGMGVSVGS